MFVVLYKDEAGSLQKIQAKRKQTAIKAIQDLYDNHKVTEVEVINGKPFSVQKVTTTSVNLVELDDEEEKESAEADGSTEAAPAQEQASAPVQ